MTNYIVAEILTLINEKIDPDTANEVLDRLIAGAHFEIQHAPQSDFNAGEALFRRDPELSFVDATIAAYMRREDIEYLYSFDDDFDSLDHITRLATPENPFA